MSTALQLNPKSVNYLQPTIVFQNIKQNYKEVILSGDVSAAETPRIYLDGSGRAQLNGSVNIEAGSPSANYRLCDLPSYLFPLNSDWIFPVCVLRAGAFIANAVKIESTGFGLESATVTSAGSYATFPTLAVVGVGEGATVAPYLKVNQASSVTSQSAAGSYAPGDVLEFVGGEGELARVNVTQTRVQSATIQSAGASGTPGTQTVTGTTGTGTKFQASVTVSGGGAITSVNSISVIGAYTVNPAVLTAEPVTGGGLVGAQLNLKMGVLTAVPNTVDGAYVDTLPTNPISTTAITGTGTGATFNALWGLDEVLVTNPGSGYDDTTTITVTGGGSSGGGAVTATVGGETSGTLTLINAPNTNDIVHLDAINFLVDTYGV